MVADKFAFVKYSNNSFHLFLRPENLGDDAVHSISGFIDEF